MDYFDKQFFKDLNEKQRWILKYINENKPHRIDVYCQNFVDEYIKQFNPRHFIKPFGANKVPELSGLLSDMYKKCYLLRDKVGLRNMEPGFSKWLYSYYIEKQN